MQGQNPVLAANPFGSTVPVNPQSFGAKYQTKREVYRFLAAEVKAYLGAFETMTAWHLRDLEAGDKTIIEAKEIKHINIPNYEGLTIKAML